MGIGESSEIDILTSENRKIFANLRKSISVTSENVDFRRVFDVVFLIGFTISFYNQLKDGYFHPHPSVKTKFTRNLETPNWSSQVPNIWKRNAIVSALHRAKRNINHWVTDVQSIR